VSRAVSVDDATEGAPLIVPKGVSRSYGESAVRSIVGQVRIGGESTRSPPPRAPRRHIG
jgi:hypothetical protein